jgi:hypothetical protein
MVSGHNRQLGLDWRAMVVADCLFFNRCKTVLLGAAMMACGAACGDVVTAPPSDAAPDATVNQSSTCDPLGVFSPPVQLTIPANIQSSGVPRFSADELQLYSDFNGGTLKTQLFSLIRSSLTADFVENNSVSSLNSAFDDTHPYLNRNGLALWFESGRVSGGIAVYLATRATTLAAFGSAVSSTVHLNDSTNDAQPFVSYDANDNTDNELWFVSDRANTDLTLGSFNILKSTINSGGSSTPTFVNELNSDGKDFFPTVSADGLTVYISSDRRGGVGGFDIWRSHRRLISDPFPAPSLVPELNDASNNFASWISKDNCRLYGRNDQGYIVASRR